MNFDQTIQHCREIIEMMPAQALAEVRKKHPDIGAFAIFPVYAPQEIIHAAGLLPFGIFGAGTKIDITIADSRFQSFICSIAKSTLELFLQGHMDDFKGAVFSSICDTARNLASVVKRNVPEMYIEYLHLPQNMASTGSLAYTIAEYERFRNNLSAQIDRPITKEAITNSLQIYNRLRSLTYKLYRHRRDNPGSITAAQLCTVVQAGTQMMPEDFVDILDDLLTSLNARHASPRDSVRVVIEGAFCEQPPIELIESMEAAGCEIRDDDMIVGWRLFPNDVPTDGDPIESLAAAYIGAGVYTSVRFDNDNPRTQGLLDKLKHANADAVLFAPAKFCEPALLDYVLFRKTLDEADIPHLKLEFEEKMWTFDRLRTEVETFAESMLFE